ncbi:MULTISPECIES: co-chaperone GroES [Anaerococcus]|uniref:co-chaperone GroES n=1 Tax=Anaerococcus TaxID=165779 RepID=UPI0008A409EB|nr:MULTISPECIES: co-chaperone GroES [Anaerococcus]MBS6921825.1 co-chaperone GroES [Anaerococcus vaginalis]MDU1707151.1 co-chaperone GroES [Anaerococcus vaginalis]MDU1763919.1 co-chaperone GroES [Anaerococcus vaginalis]MDU5086986.1 co-chaperone GroES [Anaerococcus vaginalis]MDU5560774.1 co-chaperone GroES [Anaerococcus vaginalis]
MNLKPIGERVVIKKLEAEKKTQSGIVLPESAQEKPQYAEVVAISSDILNDKDKKDSLKEGDKVIYSQYAGTDVKIDGENYVVLAYKDVLAVVE